MTGRQVNLDSRTFKGILNWHLRWKIKLRVTEVELKIQGQNLSNVTWFWVEIWFRQIYFGKFYGHTVSPCIVQFLHSVEFGLLWLFQNSYCTMRHILFFWYFYSLCKDLLYWPRTTSISDKSNRNSLDYSNLLLCNCTHGVLTVQEAGPS